MAGALRLTDDEFRVIFDRINKNIGTATTPRAPTPRKRSTLEIIFAQQLDVLRLPAPVREHQAIPNRKYRLDFAWPDRRIGVEVQGMVHRIKGRFQRDTEKACLHILHGWRVLPVCRADIVSGRAAAWITTLLESP